MYGSITNCYNTGSVKGVGTASAGVGGVCETAVGSEVTNCYNIGTLSGQTVGNVINSSCKTLTNSYYLADGETDEREGTTAMSADQFASGEVAWLLNGERSEGAEENPLAWYQNIGVDSYPVLDSSHKTVYCGYKDCTLSYSNNPEGLSKNPVHNYDNGICKACKAYQPATQNSGKYEIGNAGQLYWFAGLVNGTLTDGTPQNTAACAELASNITLNTGVLKTDGSLADDVSTFTGWTPIGSLANKYTGTFDGKNYTVGGLYFNDGEATRVGLIGYAYNTTIANVGVIDAYINAKDDIGGVCGITENCTIDHCYNTGTISAGDGAVIGGVCGYALHSSVNNSYNTGTISAGSSANVGGVCGRAANISNCYNTGAVSATGTYSNVGGVCGKLSGTLDNSHNTGTVTAAAEAACIGGVCSTNETGTIELCYNTGAVNFTGTTDMAPRMGGVCGENTGTITNCYNSGALTSARYGTMLGGVCGLSDLNVPITNCYNSGTVSAKGDYVGGVCGYKKTGTVANCYYLDGCDANGSFAATTEGTATTTTTFAGGSVAYLLAQGCSVAETAYPGNEWGQTIGTDTYPLLGGAAVYRNETYTGCEGNPGELLYAYANTPAEPVYAEHHYENGFCTGCGAYEPATLTTDKYDIDGNDTKDKVYEIGNAGQLYWFAALVNGTLTDGTAQNLSANAVLVADIVYNENVLNETGELNSANAANFKLWTPIGNVYENPYKGIFDGKGHVIRGLYCTHKLGDYGYSFIARNEGTVKNLGIEDSYFEGTDLGGVCWKNYGTIENCYSISYLFGAYGASGICSENTGTIKNSFHIGTVKSGYYSHPICYTNEGEITNCFYLGDDSSDATAKTAAQFANGEVCYLLNESKSAGVWGQTLSGTGKQDYPVLGGMRVYYRAEVYANTYGILTEGTQTITASSSPNVWYEFTPEADGTYLFVASISVVLVSEDISGVATGSPCVAKELVAETTYYVCIPGAPTPQADLTIKRIEASDTLLKVGANTAYITSPDALWYAFTPAETGYYQFSSTDIKGSICVNTKKTNNIMQGMMNSPIYRLIAKTTYYVCFSYAPGEYDLTIAKLNTTLQLGADNAIMVPVSTSEPIWYEFTPTETGTYQFSSTDIKGSICVNTTKTDDDKQNITTSPTYSLSAGITYYVYVNYASGEYNLTITKLSTTTALEAVTASPVYAVDGRIVCAGEFRIYDLLGRDVTRLNGSLCGVYVVKIGEAAVKIVVRYIVGTH